MSLYLVSGLAWKSDHILGHIYAEIEQILKGSQTFKQHCMCIDIFLLGVCLNTNRLLCKLFVCGKKKTNMLNTSTHFGFITISVSLLCSVVKSNSRSQGESHPSAAWHTFPYLDIIPWCCWGCSPEIKLSYWQVQSALKGLSITCYSRSPFHKVRL